MSDKNILIRTTNSYGNSGWSWITLSTPTLCSLRIESLPFGTHPTWDRVSNIIYRRGLRLFPLQQRFISSYKHVSLCCWDDPIHFRYCLILTCYICITQGDSALISLPCVFIYMVILWSCGIIIGAFNILWSTYCCSWLCSAVSHRYQSSYIFRFFSWFNFFLSL